MNTDYFIKGIEFVPEYLLGTIVLYFVVILFINMVGLKSFSKMSSYDFAHTIAIGSLIASAISTGKPSIAVGILLIGLLFFLKFIISFFQKKSSSFESMVNNPPCLLMKDGEILEENLKKNRVTEGELMGKLREANVFKLSHVKAVVLETTGDMSVLHSKEELELDEILLEGVKEC